MTRHALVGLTASGLAIDLGRSLRAGFYMFWDTLWALVLGFALSGAVQAFVGREQMQRRLGDHRPAAVVRASLYGMASSSCSYAASALSRSLVARGADFVSAQVFLFASTNLVLELGIVLLVLIGWQFLVAEFVGGVIMIALLVVAGSLWLRGRALDRALAMVDRAPEQSNHHDPAVDSPAPWRTLAGWADAAGYTIGDLTMLRREMVVGFGVAGFLTELVPVHFWTDIFVRGHGLATSIENVAVGPLLAVISFVCSIGNVPLAAALWTGGIGFGGVVAFVFADLITLPLLFVYRRQYGTSMALRMVAVFWPVMSVAGLATEYLFRANGWLPTVRRATFVSDSLRLNATTVLDVVALLLLVGTYLLYRARPRLGGDAASARDPVCGMQVERSSAPATARHGTETYYFCSDRCRDRFSADPGRFTQPVEAPAPG